VSEEEAEAEVVKTAGQCKDSEVESRPCILPSKRPRSFSELFHAEVAREAKCGGSRLCVREQVLHHGLPVPHYVEVAREAK
jgi:hypothetical protein